MKRVLSVVLCLAILLGTFSAVGFNASAQESNVNINNCCETLEEVLTKKEMDDLYSSISSFVMNLNGGVSGLNIQSFKVPWETKYKDALKYYVYFYVPESLLVTGIDFYYFSTDTKHIGSILFYSGSETMPSGYYFRNLDILMRGVKDNDNLSDVQKALLLHDRLVYWAEYGNSLQVYNQASTDNTAYGAIAQRRTKCRGYALAYMYLGTHCGLKVKYVQSDVLEHAWNIIFIDGKGYYIDCTWDDPVPDNPGNVLHKNFMRSAEGMKETGHIKDGVVDWNDAYNNTEYDDYYWQDSDSAFQLIDNELYYLNNKAGTINKADQNHTVICTVEDKAYATLSSFEDKLIFNSLSDYYQYNLTSKHKSIIYTPNLASLYGEDFFITGFIAYSEYGSDFKIECYAYNSFRCPVDTRNEKYRKVINYKDLVFDESHKFVDNVCSCGFHEYDFTLNSNDEAIITKCNIKTATELAPPTTLEGHKAIGIEEEAFKDNRYLESVTIPSGYTYIGARAFSGCENLTEVSFPNTITEIGEDTLKGTAYIIDGRVEGHWVIYDPEASHWENGLLYIGDIVVAAKSKKEINIKEGTRVLCNSCFSGNDGLTKVVIPSTLKSISANAFKDCTALKDVNIPESITKIGKNAFYNCSALESVYIPKNMKSLGSYAFYKCSSLESIKVDEQNTAFDSRDNCNALIFTSKNTLITGCKNSTIPSGVKEISAYAFAYCLDLPSVTIPDSVETIGKYAFHNCAGLKSVTVPDSVTQMGDSVFRWCNYLESAVVGNGITALPAQTFYHCLALKDVTLPAGMDSIGSEAFYLCQDLESITLPDTVKTIGTKAFSSCSALMETVLPLSLTTVEADAFTGCSGFRNVLYKGNSEQWALVSIDSGNSYLLSAKIIYNYVPHDHNFASSEITKEATCSAKGEKIYTCSVCEGTKKEVLPMTAHSFSDGSCSVCGVKDPTCISEVITGSCTKSVRLPKSEKYYVSFTPDSDGKITFSTTGDGYFSGYVYDSEMHVLTSKEYYSSNNFKVTYSLKAGNNYYLACSASRVENYSVIFEYTPSHTHSYTDVVTQPTCTEQGYTTHTCACGDVKVDTYVAALGHDMSFHSAKNETCTEAGNQAYYECSRCHNYYADDKGANLIADKTAVVTPAKQHKFEANEQYCLNGCGTANPDYVAPAHVHVYVKTVVSPKSNAVGYTLNKCACGNSFKSNYTAPTGKPSGFKCSSRTAAAIKFTWNKTSGASGYQVQISNAKGNAWGTSKVLTANSYTFSKLTAGSAYKARVRFYIKAADGKNYYGAWTTITSPTLPAGTSITKVTGAKKAFTAQWKKAAVTGYQLQYAANNKFSGAKTVTIKKAATLKYSVSKLAANKTFYVRVRTYKAISGANYYSTWSAIKSVKTK